MQTHTLVVADVVHETDASRSLVLEVPVALRSRFRYRAGQFVTVEVPWGGFDVRRCYSLSSSPDVDAAMAITVKRVPGGRLSNWLIDHVRPGDQLRVTAPEGRFVLDPDAGAGCPLLFFAAGSGITPVLSLLKTALATTGRRARLVYANTDRGNVIFDAAIGALAAAYGERLEVRHHLDVAQGLLDERAAATHARGLEDADCYVCGPEPFMDVVEAGLIAAGVDPGRVRFERFVSPLDPDRVAPVAPIGAGAPDGAVAPDAVDGDAAAPGSFEVTLRGRRHVVPYTPGRTLLACCQAAGVPAPSSCEDGFCGSCMATDRKSVV